MTAGFDTDIWTEEDSAELDALIMRLYPERSQLRVDPVLAESLVSDVPFARRCVDCGRWTSGAKRASDRAGLARYVAHGKCGACYSTPRTPGSVAAVQNTAKGESAAARRTVVLRLLAEGLKPRQIARQLRVSDRTVYRIKQEASQCQP